MSKEKRTYNAEVVNQTSLQLHRTAPSVEEHPTGSDQKARKRQIFSPELISRLAERIKKL